MVKMLGREYVQEQHVPGSLLELISDLEQREAEIPVASTVEAT